MFSGDVARNKYWTQKQCSAGLFFWIFRIYFCVWFFHENVHAWSEIVVAEKVADPQRLGKAYLELHVRPREIADVAIKPFQYSRHIFWFE